MPDPAGIDRLQEARQQQQRQFVREAAVCHLLDMFEPHRTHAEWAYPRLLAHARDVLADALARLTVPEPSA